MAILIIIKATHATLNDVYAIVFDSVGAAMAYTDENTDYNVKVIGSDDKVYNRVGDRWIDV